MTEPLAVPKDAVSLGPHGANRPHVSVDAARWDTVVTQLRLMTRMTENWDGYGAAAPRAELIDVAVRVAKMLAQQGDVSPPYVTPTRIGGALFEWEHGSHQVELEVEGIEKLSFLYLNRDTNESIDIEGSPDILLKDGAIRDRLRDAARFPPTKDSRPT